MWSVSVCEGYAEITVMIVCVVGVCQRVYTEIIVMIIFSMYMAWWKLKECDHNLAWVC